MIWLNVKILPGHYVIMYVELLPFPGLSCKRNKNKSSNVLLNVLFSCKLTNSAHILVTVLYKTIIMDQKCLRKKRYIGQNIFFSTIFLPLNLHIQSVFWKCLFSIGSCLLQMCAFCICIPLGTHAKLRQPSSFSCLNLPNLNQRGGRLGKRHVLLFVVFNSKTHSSINSISCSGKLSFIAYYSQWSRKMYLVW